MVVDDLVAGIQPDLLRRRPLEEDQSVVLEPGDRCELARRARAEMGAGGPPGGALNGLEVLRRHLLKSRRCSVRTTSWQVNSWRHWPLSGSTAGGALVEGTTGVEVAPAGAVESFWPHPAARSASPITHPIVRFMALPFRQSRQSRANE